MTHAGHSESGFTLVEILMVVFIIGLSSSLVIMSLPERNTGLQQDAIVLQRDVEVLADRAVLTGVPHALEFNGRGYEGVARQAGQWVPLRGFEREISRDVALRIVNPGVPAGNTMRIIFDPTGAPTGGQLSLSARGDRFEIALNKHELKPAR